jgi:hypothetical protein
MKIPSSWTWCRVLPTRVIQHHIPEEVILYEECHLLGYKTPVRTTQEKYYLSVTEASRLIICMT